MLPKDEQKILIYLRKYTIEHGEDKRPSIDCNTIGPTGPTAIERLYHRGLLSYLYLPDRGCSFWRTSLSVEGRDLADKYMSWYQRSNLWYQEYIKPGWIMLILSHTLTFIVGVATGLVLAFLLARFFPASQ
jgi:hypothetical protein